MQNNIYSVSQVNKYIKNMFLTDYMLSSLEVRGEISNLKYHSSGHIYFTLKDDKGAIRCVMFASNRAGLKFVLKEGMEVIVKGSCDVYERDGSYQIYAKEIKEEGLGNLFEQYEKLKEELRERGMFDPMYKKPLPKYAKTLGVVTAPTGAAVRDIIDVSKRRNKGIQIILYPAIVQGAEAPDSIVKGIKALETYGVDVMIIGRGGGSIEDLWGFNDEKVAQAVFDCSVPIISAVGHETDFTIADFVSDMRAPTPSAAAELAVCDISTLVTGVNEAKRRLALDMSRKIFDARKTNANLSNRLMLLSPKTKLNDSKNKISLLRKQLNKEMEDKLTKARYRLKLNAGRLETHSPLLKLSSGFSYIENEDGKNIKSIKDVKPFDELKIYVTDGCINATVNDKGDENGK